jgi:prefoldin subunit 2
VATVVVPQLANKLAEFEMELSEHELVVNQLRPLDKGRKAYRLVGGVLVERTVGEVIPALEDNAAKVRLLETKGA